MKYKTIFTKRNTFTIICLCWTISILHIIIHFFDGCDMYYNNLSSVWSFSLTTCGTLISWISDVGFDILFLFLIFGINITTFVKMCSATRLYRTTSRRTRESKRPDSNVENRRKAEIRLFKQSCTHVFMFVFEPISLNILSTYLANEFWGYFFTTTFVWQITHICNSVVFIFFNANVKKFICSIITCQDVNWLFCI